MLFAFSVYKSLSHPNNTITCNAYRIPKNADEINEEFDAFVIPLANAFRPSFLRQLNALTDLIRKLRIPCIVVGVGAQHSLDGKATNPIVDDAVKKFAYAVLDKSHSIGVRGDHTREYLHRLGFSDVVAIGCPSIYFNDGQIHIRHKPVTESSKIAVNLTKGMPDSVWNLFRRTWNNLDCTYVAQDITDFEYIYWGKPITAGVKKGDAFPAKINHPLYANDRIRIYTHLKPWLESLSKFDFSFGTRIHGNIAALLAGTPSVVIAHDSRTLEMSQFYEIPFVRTDEINEHTSAISLYENADFSKLTNAISGKFDQYLKFLENNGLRHIYHDSNAVSEFNRKFFSLTPAGEIGPILSCSKKELASRISTLHVHYDAKLENAKASVDGK